MSSDLSQDFLLVQMLERLRRRARGRGNGASALDLVIGPVGVAMAVVTTMFRRRTCFFDANKLILRYLHLLVWWAVVRSHTYSLFRGRHTGY